MFFVRRIFSCVLLAAILSGCSSIGHIGHIGRFSTVVVDAGHGGLDRGARAYDGSPEKNYTLDTAKRLEKKLKARGYHVIMTRKGDYFVPLPTRAATSNKQWGAIFVSIHYNDSRRRAAQGVETYYYSSRSYPLAARIQQEISRFSTNRGTKRARFHVLRNNTKPAALVELGFLSNPRELKRIKSSRYRDNLAEAVARGISRSAR